MLLSQEGATGTDATMSAGERGPHAFTKLKSASDTGCSCAEGPCQRPELSVHLCSWLHTRAWKRLFRVQWTSKAYGCIVQGRLTGTHRM